MEKAGNDVVKAIEQLGLLEKFNFYHLKFIWSEIVGETLSRHSYISKIANRKIIVVVTNSVWMQELFMLKREILKKINEQYKKEIIEDLQFINGRKKINLIETENKEAREERKVLKDILLTKEKEREIKENIKILPKEIQENFKLCLFNFEKQEIYYKENNYEKCQKCRRWLNKKEKCFFCYLDKKNADRSKIYNLLLEKPWSNYQEINDSFPSTQDDYNEVKRKLIYNLIDKVKLNQATLIDEANLCMLITRREPIDLTDEDIKNILKKFRNNKNKESRN